ncbi:MAG: peptide chain release factor 2 [Firmicutes bacterium]|nr:peptide chain release factor 2 [Bacillota bacterium]MBQ6842354.1 peptide chain release factor 2 [Bacillota bacterium]
MELELKPIIAERRARLEELRRSLDLEGKEARIAELEQQMLEPNFWDDKESSQKVIKSLSEVKDGVRKFRYAESLLEDAEASWELALEADEEELAQEAAKLLDTCGKELENLDLELMLSGEYDNHDAIMTLHAGAGGLEAQDWVSILLRMYTRYAERHGYKVEMLDSLPADEGGYKSVTISIVGSNAYGYLRSEHGVHRLVRISPYDAAGRRQTSFASVEVMPQVEDDSEVEIRPEDIQMEATRSSGAGGQHINKTSSAVRLTHIPTGIVVFCQEERSQFSNRDRAMQMLRSKLLELKIQQQEAELAEIRGEQHEIGWGRQIRSYVFQPYRLVKDLRTGYEMGNVDAVMDGELDGFIASYLHGETRD